jgi:hypothetical protein
MHNPYAKVAMTYIRHILARGNIFLLICAWVIMAAVAISRDAHTVAMPLLFAVFVCFGLAMHMVEQFANWRAHLLPNFRRVHAIVAAVTTFVVIIALSAMLALLAGCSVVATIAILVFCFGANLLFCEICLARSKGGPLSVIHAIGFVLLAVSWVLVLPRRRELVEFMSGQLELHAIILSCMGLMMVVLGAVQLFRLHDDVPEARFSLRWVDRVFNPSAGWRRPYEWMVKGRLVFRPPDGEVERLTEHARRASTSRWSAVCRWRVGMPNSLTSWLFGVGVALAVQFVGWIAFRGRLEPSTFFWLAFVVWLIACPSFMLLSRLARRNYLLGYGIMLPVERRAYLKQVGMAVALSWLRKWGGMYVAFMLWWITAAPEPLRLGLAVNILACSAGAQVGLFGIVLCVASSAQRESTQRLPLLLPLVGGAIGGVLGLPIGLVCVALSLGKFLVPLAGAALFAMFGLLLTWFAYRHWLGADFD